MLSFSETLKEQMLIKELNPALLAEKIGVHKTTIYEYLKQAKLPTLAVSLALAEVFNYSLEYLFGRNDTNYIKIFNTCPPFSQQLRYLLKHYRCSEYRMLKETKISNSRAHAWLSGKSQPSMDNIAKLADYFATTLDVIVGREN